MNLVVLYFFWFTAKNQDKALFNFLYQILSVILTFIFPEFFSSRCNLSTTKFCGANIVSIIIIIIII